jgi:NAD(P)-dependent dehydrogenase (short-subunit alcohol dehydrogenase family)
MTAGALAGRIAVITGGGRGIGRAIAERFGAEGATVVVSARTQSQLDETVTAAGGRALAVVADAMDREQARWPVQRAIEAYGRVDIVVNNVGGSVGTAPDPFTGDDDTFEQTLLLNLVSAFWTTRAALPGMKEQGFGRIVNIGSGASRHAAASLGYTAAKHGLVGYTKQLAQATGRLGITVNCVCPGWTDTSLVDFERMARAKGTTPEAEQERAHRESAQHRMVDPSELAGMVVLLASADGGAITGQVIGVDGGYRL